MDIAKLILSCRTVIMLCLVFVNTSVLTLAQTGQDPILTATERIETARTQQAELLAPKSFAKAQEEYRRYVAMVRDKRPDTEIQNAWDQFNSTITSTLNRMVQARSILSGVLSAREGARVAKAPSVAIREYQAAEDRLKEAVNKLEANKLSEADLLGRGAAQLYRKSEVTAIKVTLIGPAQTTLAEARSRKAQDYSPITFANAQSLIKEIETALDRNESDMTVLQEKADRAEHEARHALTLATGIDTLSRQESNWERLLLHQESIVARVSSLAGFEYRFDQDLDLTFARFTDQRDSLSRTIHERDGQIEILTARIDSLETVHKQQQIRLASMLEQYQTDMQTRKEDLERRRRELDAEMHKKTVIDAATQAQTRFDKKEAIVLRVEDGVIIRVVGLDFAPGQTTIPEKAYPILNKLGALIDLYPNSSILINGHTDATGKEDKNIEYSEARAASVKKYLVDKDGRRESRIKAVGFGSSKPIASNETRLGREQNRRIEVLILFDKRNALGSP